MQKLAHLIPLVALFLISASPFMAEEKPTDPPHPPGGIHLIEDYQHERQQGIDSMIGRIYKDEGMEIRYDIGSAAGDLASRIKPEDRLWTIRQKRSDLSAEVVKTKDDRMIATFTQGDNVFLSPANFYATVKTEEDLASFLTMVMTYSGYRNAE